jgi:hypothetical protein
MYSFWFAPQFGIAAASLSIIYVDCSAVSSIFKNSDTENVIAVCRGTAALQQKVFVYTYLVP